MKEANQTSGEESFANPVVVVNGFEDTQYTNMLSLDPKDPLQLVCVDGNRIIYFAREEKEHFIVIDGVRGPSFERTGFGPCCRNV